MYNRGDDHIKGDVAALRDKLQALLARLYGDKALYAAIQDGCEESMRRFSTENVMGEFSRRLS